MIVSDSTTLIILLDLNKLDLLTNVFSKIIIPKAVYEEITFKKPIKQTSLIEIKQPTNKEALEALNMMLDRGESEAIALALELNLGLIIDEKKGRKIEINQGLKIIGLLGIIYLNVRKNFLNTQEARAFLSSAIDHGYRISQKLIEDMFEKLIEENESDL